MKSFIDRNPKEKAVEAAFATLARNGYVSERADPADNVFSVVERLKRERDQADAMLTSPEINPEQTPRGWKS